MLTKKEKKQLDQELVIIEKPDNQVGEPRRFRVFMSLTEGQLLSLTYGMTAYGEAGSSVGYDVAAFIRNTMDKQKIDY